MKKAMSLLLVLALTLAIFALPAAAQTHDHDGCTACAEEIQPRVKTMICPVCGSTAYYTHTDPNGRHWYKCSGCPYTAPGPSPW